MRSNLPLFRPAGGGIVRDVLGMTHVTKATADETDGAFVLFEITVPPGRGAPMHRHAVDAECFYVLDGTLTLTTPEGRISARAGDTCFLPATGAHSFCNEGSEPVRALVIATPGRAAEAFFTEIDESLRGREPDPAQVSAIAARHELTILPPASRL